MKIQLFWLKSDKVSSSYSENISFVLQSALGLRTPIVDPIIGFEPVWEFALQNGYIEIRAKTFFFPKLGVTAQREDVNIASSAVATQPKNGPPKKIPVHPKMLHFVATRFDFDLILKLGNLSFSFSGVCCLCIVYVWFMTQN